MSNQNRYKLFLAGFAILLFLTVNYFGGKQDDEKFGRFNNTTIDGRLTDIIPHKGAVDIIVDGQRFTFIPVFTNDQTEFRFFAKTGDSIFKEPQSSVLTLFHNRKTYVYRFEKM